MAKVSKHSKSVTQQKLERRYYDYRRRAKKKISKWEEGYLIPKSKQLPDVPKRITEASIRRLKRITGREADKEVKQYTAKQRAKEVKEAQKEERVQPIESKNHATQQILEDVIKTIKERIKEYSDYDPYDVFKFLTESFAIYKSNAVSKIVSWLQDAVDYLDNYLDDKDMPENVISYAAYIEKNAELLHSLADKVAYDSGGKDHTDDISNMNGIQEILMGGKLGVSQQVTINDIMGA